MGSMIGALILAAIGWIVVSLLNTWLRAEATAWFETLPKWIILKGAETLPEDERAAAAAEILSINVAKKSPTARMIDALSFYFQAGRAARALQANEGPLPWFRTKREARLAMHKAAGASILVIVGGFIEGSALVHNVFTSGHASQFPIAFVTMLLTILGPGAFGAIIIVRHFLALRRARKLIRA